MSNLSDIVDVTIEIQAPVSNSTSFSNILLVLEEPTDSGKIKLENVNIITKADDLLEFGYDNQSDAYTAATIAYAQEPKPNEMYFTIRKKKSEEIEAQYEELSTTLARASEVGGWYGIYLVGFETIEEIESAMKWTEANEKLFGFTITKLEEFFVSTPYFRSFSIYSEQRFAGLAWMTKCFGYEAGSETWAMKTLASVSDSKITANERKELKEKNINFYTRYANKNITQEGKTLAGEWIDVIRFRDWLLNKIQINVFNLFAINKKIPYNDAGITAVENQIIAALKEGQRAGGIDEKYYDEEGNEVTGYRTLVPKAASLSETEKSSRKLKNIRFTARLSGAIHLTEMNGTLVY